MPDFDPAKLKVGDCVGVGYNHSSGWFGTVSKVTPSGQITVEYGNNNGMRFHKRGHRLGDRPYGGIYLMDAEELKRGMERKEEENAAREKLDAVRDFVAEHRRYRFTVKMKAELFALVQAIPDLEDE